MPRSQSNKSKGSKVKKSKESTSKAVTQQPVSSEEKNDTPLEHSAVSLNSTEAARNNLKSTGLSGAGIEKWARAFTASENVSGSSTTPPTSTLNNSGQITKTDNGDRKEELAAQNSLANTTSQASMPNTTNIIATTSYRTSSAKAFLPFIETPKPEKKSLVIDPTPTSLYTSSPAITSGSNQHSVNSSSTTPFSKPSNAKGFTKNNSAIPAGKHTFAFTTNDKTSNTIFSSKSLPNTSSIFSITPEPTKASHSSTYNAAQLLREDVETDLQAKFRFLAEKVQAQESVILDLKSRDPILQVKQLQCQLDDFKCRFSGLEDMIKAQKDVIQHRDTEILELKSKVQTQNDHLTILVSDQDRQISKMKKEFSRLMRAKDREHMRIRDENLDLTQAALDEHTNLILEKDKLNSQALDENAKLLDTINKKTDEISLLEGQIKEHTNLILRKDRLNSQALDENAILLDTINEKTAEISLLQGKIDEHANLILEKDKLKSQALNKHAKLCDFINKKTDEIFLLEGQIEELREKDTQTLDENAKLLDTINKKTGEISLLEGQIEELREKGARLEATLMKSTTTHHEAGKIPDVLQPTTNQTRNTDRECISQLRPSHESTMFSVDTDTDLGFDSTGMEMLPNQSPNIKPNIDSGVTESVHEGVVFDAGSGCFPQTLFTTIKPLDLNDNPEKVVEYINPHLSAQCTEQEPIISISTLHKFISSPTPRGRRWGCLLYLVILLTLIWIMDPKCLDENHEATSDSSYQSFPDLQFPTPAYLQQAATSSWINDHYVSGFQQGGVYESPFLDIHPFLLPGDSLFLEIWSPVNGVYEPIHLLGRDLAKPLPPVLSFCSTNQTHQREIEASSWEYEEWD